MSSSNDLVDLLMSVFGVETHKGHNVARWLDLQKFDSNFRRLEGIVGGFENANKIITEGNFLCYDEMDLKHYFVLAQEASSKIDYSQSVPIQVFYSTDSLVRFLRTEKAKETVIDSSKLNVSKYRLLHKDNPQSQKYLDALVTHGNLSVQKQEHWNKSGDGKNGLRGLHIIRKIAYDLTILFDELGLPKPEYNLNHGQLNLSVPPYTVLLLRKIRSTAYSSQR